MATDICLPGNNQVCLQYLENKDYHIQTVAHTNHVFYLK